MAGRLSRFLNLERRRPAAPSRGADTEGTAPERSGRFEALQPHGASPPDVRSAQGHLARFDAPAGGDLLVQERREQDAPFVRCVRCQVDSGQFALSCGACGADFDAPEQRAFNERVWEERRAQREAELAQHRLMQQARDRDIAEAAAERRAYYEELARTVGQETRKRIADDGSDWLSWRWRRGRHQLLPAGVNLGILVVVSGIIASSVLAVGGTRLPARALIFAAVVIAVSAARWFLSR